MANVLDKQTMEFIPSVNTPDYPEDRYLVNPDMTVINSVPRQYLKIVDKSVVEMSVEEKAAVDTIKAEEKPDTRCPYGYTDTCEYFVK